DGHKIVFFQEDPYGFSGQRLDQQFLANPARCSDHLLRWHFRQAVLANIRGNGELIREHDFPPGSDMMGQILSAPQAKERMEFELFGRLSAYL
ncbi:hypothetical protein MMC31_005499, partial [Peltigera leucophlebia]|nr:hypothetical protein [Peltigera leucophlebia]